MSEASFFILIEQEQFPEPAFEGLGIKISLDASLVTNGNNAGFLADNDHHSVRFITEANPRPVAHPERAIEIDALSDRKSAACNEHAIAAHDDTAIVQWGLCEKERDDQLRRKLRIELGSALTDRLKILIALDGNQGAELAIGKIERGIDELLDHFRRLGCRCEHPVTSQRRQRPANLGLEEHDHREDECRGDVPENPA